VLRPANQVPVSGPTAMYPSGISGPLGSTWMSASERKVANRYQGHSISAKGAQAMSDHGPN
jgi:hypothetical protein